MDGIRGAEALERTEWAGNREIRHWPPEIEGTHQKVPHLGRPAHGHGGPIIRLAWMACGDYADWVL